LVEIVYFNLFGERSREEPAGLPPRQGPRAAHVSLLLAEVRQRNVDDMGCFRRVAICLALSAALVACGGSDDSSDVDATQPSTTSTTETETGLFKDPQGSYEMKVDPTWDPQHGTIAAEIEAWVVGQPEGGFAPNVNVLTQRAPGLDLSEYLDVSVEQGPSLIADFELVERAVVDGTDQELGVLEYTGSQNSRSLHFLATIALRDGTAVVATFTAPRDVFDELRPDVEPFLLSLRAA